MAPLLFSEEDFQVQMSHQPNGNETVEYARFWSTSSKCMTRLEEAGFTWSVIKEIYEALRPTDMGFWGGRLFVYLNNYWPQHEPGKLFDENSWNYFELEMQRFRDELPERELLQLSALYRRLTDMAEHGWLEFSELPGATSERESASACLSNGLGDLWKEAEPPFSSLRVFEFLTHAQDAIPSFALVFVYWICLRACDENEPVVLDLTAHIDNTEPCKTEHEFVEYATKYLRDSLNEIATN